MADEATLSRAVVILMLLTVLQVLFPTAQLAVAFGALHSTRIRAAHVLEGDMVTHTTNCVFIQWRIGSVDDVTRFTCQQLFIVLKRGCSVATHPSETALQVAIVVAEVAITILQFVMATRPLVHTLPACTQCAPEPPVTNIAAHLISGGGDVTTNRRVS